ncbi:hypothetical protein THAOC_35855 [Thalassiosira oceanica]|uniref:Uncharacterized protein n=1 Tax=Thalassiosira oceanica TaxID=159749 RepID=K0R149_THAOC|nr:hypothetical protein THAOC_35855 [Thalassiosira oceanica]|eukprot:EJK45530.1 hypothetical protein THAOC_35855 [Thalassiosira oceanica]
MASPGGPMTAPLAPIYPQYTPMMKCCGRGTIPIALQLAALSMKLAGTTANLLITGCTRPAKVSELLTVDNVIFQKQAATEVRCGLVGITNLEAHLNQRSCRRVGGSATVRHSNRPHRDPALGRGPTVTLRPGMDAGIPAALQGYPGQSAAQGPRTPHL